MAFSYKDAEPASPLLTADPTVVTSTASHQHQQEQELLLSFNVPEPPMATKQLGLAADAAEYETATVSDMPRTLWMGDLDPWLDEDAIVDLWWQILHSKVGVKLIKPKFIKPDSGFTGVSHSGYCFVEFPLYEDAQLALALNGQLLPDIAMPSQKHYPNNPDNQKKYFRLNWASGATLTAPIIHTPEYSLFVGDLTASTTEAHLLLFFQKSFPDSIRTVRVMTDPISGKSRCFGFVRFTEELERQRALREMNGAWFGGRPLRVALATPRSASLIRKSPDAPGVYSPVQTPGMMPPPPPEFMYMGGPAGAVPPPASTYGYYPPMMEKQGDAPYGMAGQPYLDPTNTTVFVGGLRSEVSEQTLFTLFKPFGTIQQIKIPPGKNCGFLKFSTREEAEEAIQAMEGFIIGGNRVRLGWGRVSANNKKYQHQRQMAQVAQMHAASAISMGMDPVTAFAAARFPPSVQGAVPSSLGYGPIMGMPQMAPHGMRQFGVPDGVAPLGEGDDGEAPSDVSPLMPMYWPPLEESERYYQSYPGRPGPPEMLNSMFEKLSLDNQVPMVPPPPHGPPPPGFQQGIFVPYGGYMPPNYYGPANPEKTEGSVESEDSDGNNSKDDAEKSEDEDADSPETKNDK